mgnify:CR=1 FL=1
MPGNSPFATRAARVTLVMSCLFSTSGMILVFLPRWLEVERGLEGAQIGAVLSLVQFMRIFTGPALAFWYATHFFYFACRQPHAIQLRGLVGQFDGSGAQEWRQSVPSQACAGPERLRCSAGGKR